MAVVAGIVFFAIRALLALVPALTVSFPIKKWSAAGALPQSGMPSGKCGMMRMGRAIGE